ncbi:NPC intracellular cholesterol transporter 2 [Manduca sexta]|uniref:MD-2-related lipid-recognition domain-containing protein n=1 Tax=Manduca sexta TaxID=7130 RepID=A0A921ZJV9_MANSE|nr:NPC intracellular cholesterol transporter 2 [Manduca sexta]KAG6458934.1 hypothetical protein O3G_MSEX011128 [Manduca sexta]KAG6458935.1 hypothetical protein O3G_MSEX011128 [Manduca sexta]
MLRWVVLFCAVFALAKSQSTAVSKCRANPGNLPLNTHIEGCTIPPCGLPQLEDAVINISFKAPRDIQSMRTLATAYLSLGIISLPVPYDLEEQSVTCNFLTDAACPLDADQIAQYTLKMHIEKIFPVGISVTIEFRVVDQDNAPVLCLRVPVRIDPPRNNAAANNVVVGELEQY